MVLHLEPGLSFTGTLMTIYMCGAVFTAMVVAFSPTDPYDFNPLWKRFLIGCVMVALWPVFMALFIART